MKNNVQVTKFELVQSPSVQIGELYSDVSVDRMKFFDRFDLVSVIARGKGTFVLPFLRDLKFIPLIHPNLIGQFMASSVPGVRVVVEVFQGRKNEDDYIDFTVNEEELETDRDLMAMFSWTIGLGNTNAVLFNLDDKIIFPSDDKLPLTDEITFLTQAYTGLAVADSILPGSSYRILAALNVEWQNTSINQLKDYIIYNQYAHPDSED